MNGDMTFAEGADNGGVVAVNGFCGDIGRVVEEAAKNFFDGVEVAQFLIVAVVQVEG